MDAIIMPSITSLVETFKATYPQFTFTEGDEFRWNPNEQTIFYTVSSNDSASFLHELAHALLGHVTYVKDIQLLEMEREAWQHAIEIAPRYAVSISEDLLESSLDTYRDWLHARSQCPTCKATGIQTRQSVYKCLACNALWRVNDARTCGLKRYYINKNTPR